MEDGDHETTEIWAQLFVEKHDCLRLREFLIDQVGVNRRFVFRDFHLTVNHARRPMRGVVVGRQQ